MRMRSVCANRNGKKCIVLTEGSNKSGGGGGGRRRNVGKVLKEKKEVGFSVNKISLYLN